MTIAYPKLFEPIRINKLTLKNRIAMAPMGIVGLTDPDGNPSQRAIDYYIERARGGVGLIITGVFKVENEIECNTHNMHQINRSSLIPFGELSEAVHALGTGILVQLTAGFGRVAPLHILRSHPISASAVPNFHNPEVICRALEIDEIEAIVKAFGQAAETLAACGVDGIELHGHEGYLLDQFTTTLWNTRTDRYGGDLRKRLTLPVEILQQIKRSAGDDFIVQYRFGLKHNIKGLRSGALKGESYTEAGRDIPEGLEMARLLEEAGFDALHVDAGCYDSWYWAHPPVYQDHGCMSDMAAKVKEVVKIPVMAVGKLDVPELVERAISDGKADIVAIGRGLLADSQWTVKAAQNKKEDIRPCIGCHDGCIGRFLGGRPLSCAVNPACGREQNYYLKRVEKPRRVVIAGGGIAGMEAARAASIRGHRVTLYEKKDRLGGHLVEASVPEFKKDLLSLLDWYRNQLTGLGVDIKLGTEASEELIIKEEPEVVIAATGSVPVLPDLAGIKADNVAICTDVLLGKKKTGNKVAVLGGGLVGCETALWLAKAGKDVTILEVLPELMAGSLPVPPMNRMMLLDLLTIHRVKTIAEAQIRAINADGIIIDNDLGEILIEAETIVIASGLKPDNRLYKVLSPKMAEVYAIGDCQNPRNIMGAIWDAYEVGRAI